MPFTAPGDSPSVADFLTAANDEGLDTEALKRLLWLTNSHPDLISHSQILCEYWSTPLESNVCPRKLVLGEQLDAGPECLAKDL